MRLSRGATLLDTLAALAIGVSAMALVLPGLETLRRRGDLERLARQVLSDAHRCRAEAVNCHANVGIVFSNEGGHWSYWGARDGDGDGVSRRDLQRGQDHLVLARVKLGELCRTARLGVPSDWRAPDPSGSGLLRSGDGVRAGDAAIISFTPLGDATPATVYFNDGRERLLAVRIYGGTARTRVLEWRRGWSRWRRVAI